MTIPNLQDGEIEARFYAELARKVVAKRKERRMPQQTLAAEIGVHRNTLMRWEMGEGSLPLWMLLRICDVLCCQHLLLLPARTYTWGEDLPQLNAEINLKARIQFERDRPGVTNE